MGSAVIVVSSREREHAISIGIPESVLHLVHNGVERARRPARSCTRAELGVGRAERVIGFVGRLSAQKAVENLLEAFAVLLAKRNGVRLAIVGEGPEEAALKRLADELGISPRVSWLGAVDGIAALPLLDVFALPSRYEGFPYVLLEALARGLPIVTTDVGGAREVVEEGVNGFIVAREAPEALARALIRLLDDDALRRRMSVAASLRADRFTLDRMVEQTLRVYESVTD